MQTHEYRFAAMLGALSMTPLELEQDLNALAADGWRVVQFDPAKRCALLERPVRYVPDTAAQLSPTLETGGTDE